MKRLLATTALLAAFTLPASATVLDWNFQDHLGVLPNTQTFTAGGFGLTARGFTSSDAGTALFGKNGGGDENGLGLNNDLSGDHEITGGNFVQLNLDGLLGLLDINSFTFQMGSTTQNEGWKVFGSNDAHPFQFTLLASSTDPGGQEGFHTLAGGYDNYSFFYDGLGVNQCGSGCNANVLLRNFDATLVATTPLPGALPFFAAGLLGLGGLVRSLRKQCGVA
jgi:hypothetical protein